MKKSTTKYIILLSTFRFEILKIHFQYACYTSILLHMIFGAIR